MGILWDVASCSDGDTRKLIAAAADGDNDDYFQIKAQISQQNAACLSVPKRFVCKITMIFRPNTKHLLMLFECRWPKINGIANSFNTNGFSVENYCWLSPESIRLGHPVNRRFTL